MAQHFTPVDPTAVRYAVIVHNAFVNDNQLSPGDEMGVFDGELCVGMSVVHGQWPQLITCYGNDGQGQPGYGEGDPIGIRIWISNARREIEADMLFIEGNGNFGDGDYAYVALNDPELAAITIPIRANYFELVSSYLDPVRLQADYLFAAIEHLVIVYQDDGGVFIPDILNSIGIIQPSRAYLLYCGEATEWPIYGYLMNPDVTEYHLIGGRWNWVGYPFSISLPAQALLEPLQDDVAIVLNDDGEYWLPPDIITMEEMRPGSGYYMFAWNDITFQYQADFLNTMTAAENSTLPQQTETDSPGGIPYLTLVDLDPLLWEKNPETIELYSDSRLVGENTIDNSSSPVPIISWGGLPRNLNIEEGYTVGDAIRVVVRDHSGRRIVEHKDESAHFGMGPYARIFISNSPVPVEFKVSSPFPNPFNASTSVKIESNYGSTIRFSLYTIDGRLVRNDTVQSAPGTFTYHLEMNQMGDDVAAGVYFLRVSHDGQNPVIRKLVYLP